jgi:hypothetical protein
MALSGKPNVHHGRGQPAGLFIICNISGLLVGRKSNEPGSEGEKDDVDNVVYFHVMDASTTCA